MAPIRVLIVEDDSDIIELVRSVLDPEYECIEASNGLEGLQRAFVGEPDLVVCDIMMPVMDGHEFVKRLRKTPQMNHIPVIFLSALNSRDQIRDGYETGATLYLTKPIDPARFRRNIELFVKDRQLVSSPKRMTVQQMAALAEPVRSAPPAPVPKPAARPAPAAPSSPPPAKPVLAAMPGPKISPRPLRARVLIVEDDRDTVQFLRNGLGDEYEVLEANDGVAAIEKAVRYKPDLFIIDGMLPKMTGYQLTMLLRKNREFYRSPIIFISGKATERDQQYVKSLGVSHFIPKPFDADRIPRLVREITRQEGFAIRTDRIDLDQVYLEQFQQIETHRVVRPPTSLTDVERRRQEMQSRK